MASTKSTVVGIRLDHDRRAWVETEAARLGVTVRGLFEGMIDEARSGEAGEASQAIAGLGSAVPGAVTARAAEETMAAASPEASTTAERSGRVHAAASSSPCPGVGSVTGVPGGLIREAFSLTTSLIELSGRCVIRSLGSCALTRRWTQNSL